MKYLVTLVIFWVQMGHAIPSRMLCGDLLEVRPAHRLVADLVKNQASEEVRIQLRVTGEIGDYKNLSQFLEKSGYQVALSEPQVTQQGSTSHLEFLLTGLGREVAQAIIEMSNPEVGGSIPKNPVVWVYARPPEDAVFLAPTPHGAAFEALMRIRIEDLDLSIRTQNVLRNENFVFVGDVLPRHPAELLHISNFGRKSLRELETELASKGLTLGMEVPGWPYDNLFDSVGDSPDRL